MAVSFRVDAAKATGASHASACSSNTRPQTRGSGAETSIAAGARMTVKKQSLDGFMWTAKAEYKLNRRQGSYQITLYTDVTKGVDKCISRDLRATLDCGNNRLVELTQAALDQMPLTFSVQEAQAKSANANIRKWHLRFHKLRAHWHREWKEVKLVWLKLAVGDDCFLAIKIAYDALKRQRQVIDNYARCNVTCSHGTLLLLLCVCVCVCVCVLRLTFIIDTTISPH